MKDYRGIGCERPRRAFAHSCMRPSAPAELRWPYAGWSCCRSSAVRRGRGIPPLGPAPDRVNHEKVCFATEQLQHVCSLMHSSRADGGHVNEQAPSESRIRAPLCREFRFAVTPSSAERMSSVLKGSQNDG